jgi:hypothetical protein
MDMTKPHEEEWDNPEDFEVTVCGPELDRGIDGPREVLARAAPDMARALRDAVRAFRQGYRITEAQCRLMEAALDKAGAK